MITADKARELYVQPPYTEEDIETAITAAARTRNFTCLDAQRLSDDALASLAAGGFTVQSSGGDFIVSWEEKKADAA